MKTNSSFEEKYIDLDKLFVGQKDCTADKNELLSKDRSTLLNPEIVKQIAQHLGLFFILEKELEGNVCFANNEEIRSEFKQNFTSMDLRDYIFAILATSLYNWNNQESLQTHFSKIPYPKDSKTFWEMVKLGSEMRLKHQLKNKNF